jgi:hypothetical protein
LKKRKSVAEIFGWAKTVGSLRKTPLYRTGESEGPDDLHLRGVQPDADGDDPWLTPE